MLVQHICNMVEPLAQRFSMGALLRFSMGVLLFKRVEVQGPTECQLHVAIFTPGNVLS